MKLLDKYLLREYLVPVAYCLSAFGMVFVIYDLFDHLARFMDAKTPWTSSGLYYLCMLAQSIEFLVPASLLLATLYTLWHLARNNEITAMRACGFEPVPGDDAVPGRRRSSSASATAVLKEALAPARGAVGGTFRRRANSRRREQ